MGAYLLGYAFDIHRTGKHADLPRARTAGIAAAGIDYLTVQRYYLHAEPRFARYGGGGFDIIGNYGSAQKVVHDAFELLIELGKR